MSFYKSENKELAIKIVTHLEQVLNMVCEYATDGIDAEVSYSYYENCGLARNYGLIDECADVEEIDAVDSIVRTLYISGEDASDLILVRQFDIPKDCEFGFVFVSKELAKEFKKDYGFSLSWLEKNTAATKSLGIKHDDYGKGDCVYFLLFKSSNNIKVGFTSNLNKRLQAYRTHSPEEFSVIKVIKGSRRIESSVKNKLKPYRVRGEFFNASKYTLDYINSLG